MSSCPLNHGFNFGRGPRKPNPTDYHKEIKRARLKPIERKRYFDIKTGFFPFTTYVTINMSNPRPAHRQEYFIWKDNAYFLAHTSN